MKIKRQHLNVIKQVLYESSIKEKISILSNKLKKTKEKITELSHELERIKTPLATLKKDFVVQPHHIIVFTDGEAKFGYYDNDEFIEEDWPLESN